MVLSVTVARPSRRIVALLVALVLGTAIVAGATPVPAHAQSSLIAPAQTKAQAAAAEKAADANTGKDDGGSLSIGAWLGIAAVIVLGTAAYFITRDARASAGPTDPRAAPKRPVDANTVRGAPKTMFTGEGAAGGRVGRSKKREKSKRQKVARRNNR